MRGKGTLLSAVDYILEGLAKALEAERECGLRAVELDRTLLKVEEKGTVEARAASSVQQPAANGQAPNASLLESKHPNTQTTQTPPEPSNCPTVQPAFDFAFLHDRPLSAGGVEMMAKIVTAMKKTPETAPIVFTGERPKAKVYVVLGSAAMKQWFPGLRAAPGVWLRSKDGRDVLVTYSPEYILRFGPVTPTVRKVKAEMWNSLKGVMQRVGRLDPPSHCVGVTGG